MPLSAIQHKCGSIRTNHQCGLGLCSGERETEDFTHPKRKRSKVGINETGLVVTEKKI